MATHYSVLAWRIPWTEEPGRLQSTGSQRVRHDRSDLTRTHACTVGTQCLMRAEFLFRKVEGSGGG